MNSHLVCTPKSILICNKLLLQTLNLIKEDIDKLYIKYEMNKNKTAPFPMGNYEIRLRVYMNALNTFQMIYKSRRNRLDGGNSEIFRERNLDNLHVTPVHNFNIHNIKSLILYIKNETQYKLVHLQKQIIRIILTTKLFLKVLKHKLIKNGVVIDMNYDKTSFLNIKYLEELYAMKTEYKMFENEEKKGLLLELENFKSVNGSMTSIDTLPIIKSDNSTPPRGTMLVGGKVVKKKKARTAK